MWKYIFFDAKREPSLTMDLIKVNPIMKSNYKQINNQYEPCNIQVLLFQVCMKSYKLLHIIGG